MWFYTSTPSIRFHGVVLNQLSTGTNFPLFILRALHQMQRVSGEEWNCKMNSSYARQIEDVYRVDSSWSVSRYCSGITVKGLSE
jgi:hypothetical protein